MKGKYTTNTVELRKRMLEKGLVKICDLSKATGVNRDRLGTILSGKAQPSANVMIKLAEALDMTPEMAGEIFFSVNLPVA